MKRLLAEGADPNARHPQFETAIKTNLPRNQREDIASELEALLEESLEADTGKASSKLSEEEALTWLKTRELSTP